MKFMKRFLHILYKIIFFISFLVLCLSYTSQPFYILIKFQTLSVQKRSLTGEQLVDLKDFKFLLSPQVCEDCIDCVLLIFTIFSALENVKQRDTIRKTWGELSKCTKIVFLVGTKYNKTIDKDIQTESEINADIVQGNFLDTYRNLTYKHVMALKWVTNNCQKAKYMIKIDDDVTIGTDMIRNTIEANRSATDFMACDPIRGSEVQRKDSKWSVLTDEFAGEKYPDYCNGPVIIYSADVVHRLLEESTRVPFFWIDDVYITGILANRIGVKPQKLLTHWIHFRKDVLIMEDLPKQLTDNKNGSVTVDSHLMYKIWKSKFGVL